MLSLCVDLDDTLILTDTLYVQFRHMLRHAPLLLPVFIMKFLMGGRPAAKAWMAGKYPINAAALPYRRELIEYLRQQKALGRKIYLVSASFEDNVKRVADYLELFDGAFGTTSTRNLKGGAKARFIIENIGTDFCYAGDAFADLLIWKQAKAAILCGKATIFRDRLGIPVERDFPNHGSSQ